MHERAAAKLKTIMTSDDDDDDGDDDKLWVVGIGGGWGVQSEELRP